MAIFAASLLFLEGCTSTSSLDRAVTGPDGAAWGQISCGVKSECHEVAQARCPDGYFVGGESRAGWRGRGANVTYKCVSTYVAEHRPRRPRPDATPATSRAPADILVCERILARFSDAAQGWAREHGAEPRAAPPDRGEFLDECIAVPEAVQVCLHPEYRNAHHDACDARLRDLSPDERAHVTALFEADEST